MIGRRPGVGAWLGILATGMVAAGSPAQVPERVSYQGVLRVDPGLTTPDGDYGLRFRILDAAEPPVVLFEQIFDQGTDPIAVESAAYNVVLESQGGSSITDALDEGPRFLEVTIEAVPPASNIAPPFVIRPVEPIASAPYAIVARSLVTAPTGTLAPDPVPVGAIVLWLASASCPAGWSEVTGLRARHPVGADTLGRSEAIEDGPGSTGGAETHSHGGTTEMAGQVVGAPGGSGVAAEIHTHSIALDETSHMPPNTAVLFCEKS